LGEKTLIVDHLRRNQTQTFVIATRTCSFMFLPRFQYGYRASVSVLAGSTACVGRR
jgi:hypothetical protein